MDVFLLNKSTFNTQLQEILENYGHLLSYKQIKFMKIVFLRLKKYIDDEYYMVVCMLYLLNIAGVINENDKYISDDIRKKIDILNEMKEAEIKYDTQKFFEIIMRVESDLFLLKIIIKSVVISDPELFSDIIIQKNNYYKSTGWVIPILSYKNLPKLLSEFQDFYFQKVYTKQYKWIKKQYLKEIEKVDVIENFMVDVMNELTTMMQFLGVSSPILIRRKSYFSVYNKMKRGSGEDIYDFIGVRIIFENQEKLDKFAEIFEKKYVIIKKKDYIENPKPNGYQSLHYTFIYNFEKYNYYIELQMRTKEMDENIKNSAKTSHFSYSIKQKKWNELFKEIQDGVTEMQKFIK